MKLRGFSLFILFCLVFGACTNDTPNKSTRSLEVTHDYPTPEPEPKPSTPSTSPNNGNEDVGGIWGPIRGLWEEPLKVIQQMGDLKGKTVADIGAGPFGYFTLNLAAKSEVGKILALDIDPEALAYIDKSKKLLPVQMGDKIETRKVAADDPNLEEGEADIILIVNTAPYFDDRVDYFRKAKKGLPEDGKLIVIDYKKRYTPGAGPPIENRVPLAEIEKDLRDAGYNLLKVDDQTLKYQYIIIAGR